MLSFGTVVVVTQPQLLKLGFVRNYNNSVIHK